MLITTNRYHPARWSLFWLLAPVFMMLLLITAVRAEDVQNIGTVQALPWYRMVEPFLLAIVQAVVAVAVPAAAWAFYRFTGIKLADSDRSAIQNAAANAAGRILSSVEGPVANMKIDLVGPFGSIIAAEAEKIRTTLPDELERRNLTPAHVAQIIVGKVGQLQQGAITAPHP